MDRTSRALRRPIPAIREPGWALAGPLPGQDGLPEAPGSRVGGPGKRAFRVGGVSKIEVGRLGEERDGATSTHEVKSGGQRDSGEKKNRDKKKVAKRATGYECLPPEGGWTERRARWAGGRGGARK